MDVPLLPITARERIRFNLDAVRKAIAIVEGLNLAETSIDDIRLALRPVFEGRVIEIFPLNIGTVVHRARRVSDRPSYLRDLSYPPIQSTKLGRVNRAGAPVLYCSASREGAVYEVGPALGDMVAIVEWKTTAPMLVNHVGFFPDALRQLGSQRECSALNEALTKEAGGDEQAEVTRFLAMAFTRRIGPTSLDLYKMTTAIGEALFAQDMFNGLMYPTIAMSANSDNIAIKTAFADSHLQFVKAELISMTAVRPDGFEFIPQDFANQVTNEGEIMWKWRPPQFTVIKDRPLRVTAENGKWVARDPEGNIIEPS